MGDQKGWSGKTAFGADSFLQFSQFIDVIINAGPHAVGHPPSLGKAKRLQVRHFQEPTHFIVIEQEIPFFEIQGFDILQQAQLAIVKLRFFGSKPIEV